jgi:hypothetical protein
MTAHVTSHWRDPVAPVREHRDRPQVAQVRRAGHRQANRRYVVHVWDDVDRTAVYVGDARRGFEASPYATPFKLRQDGTQIQINVKYRTWLLAQPGLLERARTELRGKTLACWCAPGPCHGDVLAELVNDPAAATNPKE